MADISERPRAISVDSATVFLITAHVQIEAGPASGFDINWKTIPDLSKSRRAPLQRLKEMAGVGAGREVGSNRSRNGASAADVIVRSAALCDPQLRNELPTSGKFKWPGAPSWEDEVPREVVKILFYPASGKVVSVGW